MLFCPANASNEWGLQGADVQSLNRHTDTRVSLEKSRNVEEEDAEKKKKIPFHFHFPPTQTLSTSPCLYLCSSSPPCHTLHVYVE